MFCNIDKNGVDFTLEFEDQIENSLESNKLRLIDYQNNDIEVEIVEKIRYNALVVRSRTKLDKKMFVYGTYEKCPAVSSKVNELALIAIKNLINRVERLENAWS